MKVNTIRYERLCNLGDYEHEKVAIEIQLEDGESATTALEKAKKFCRVSSQQFSRELTEAMEEIDDLNSEDCPLPAEQLDEAKQKRDMLLSLKAEVESFGLVG